jgi:DNA-binding MarR family transcriptional regulator
VPPSKGDVQSMVVALFTMNAGLERARRRSKRASTLSLLQVVGDHGRIRPSEIAELQQVHPSLVTRQVRDLEDAGYAAVTANPADGRSCLVELTPAGADELRRLVQGGLDRFALFVADWEPGEVRMLTALLEKLEMSKATVAAPERRSAGPRWHEKASDRTDRADRLELG